jgi:predicted short-subunit dehydrogenase-like oxidoreductase (DUF2520 family)
VKLITRLEHRVFPNVTLDPSSGTRVQSGTGTSEGDIRDARDEAQAVNRPARLAIGVVSAGRVGSALGAALAAAGHTVVAASGVSRDSVRRAEELGAPVLPPDQVAGMADLVLLAIPDDALAGTVRGLAAVGAIKPGQIVVHTSGAHGVDVLAPAAERGALPLALHPAMTFTGRPEDLQRIAACGFAVTAPTGDEAAWHVGEALVVEMGAEPIRVPQHARPLYHAALTHGANHLVTLVADATDLLHGAGIDAADRLLGPLLSAALDNALRHGDRALTGPVVRGDVGTVRVHVKTLREAEPAALPAYRAMARRTAERAMAAGLLPAPAATELTELLDQEATS